MMSGLHNVSFSRDAPGAALAFSQRRFTPIQTASDVTGAGGGCKRCYAENHIL